MYPTMADDNLFARDEEKSQPSICKEIYHENNVWICQ